MICSLALQGACYCRGLHIPSSITLLPLPHVSIYHSSKLRLWGKTSPGRSHARERKAEFESNCLGQKENNLKLKRVRR